jgi:hypothetical protein
LAVRFGENMDTFVHGIAAAVLVGRLGDIVSTRLATPTLALEANPVARRLGWPLAWASLLVCLVTYYDPGLGILAAVTSFFVSGSNFSRVWIMRALGEREYLEIIHRAARRTTLRAMVGFVLASACAFLIPGVALCAFSDEPLTMYFGLGIVVYALAIALHGSAAARRFWRGANLALGGS